MKEKKSSKYYNNIVIEQKIFHCDFEIRITNAAEKVFHNINIKYWVFIIKVYRKKINYVLMKDLHIYYNVMKSS